MVNKMWKLTLYQRIMEEEKTLFNIRNKISWYSWQNTSFWLHKVGPEKKTIISLQLRRWQNYHNAILDNPSFRSKVERVLLGVLGSQKGFGPKLLVDRHPQPNFWGHRRLSGNLKVWLTAGRKVLQKLSHPKRWPRRSNSGRKSRRRVISE